MNRWINKIETQHIYNESILFRVVDLWNRSLKNLRDFPNRAFSGEFYEVINFALTIFVLRWVSSFLRPYSEF